MRERQGLSLLSSDDTGKVRLKWVLKTSGGTLDSLGFFFFPKARLRVQHFSLCVCDVDNDQNSCSPP